MTQLKSKSGLGIAAFLLAMLTQERGLSHSTMGETECGLIVGE